MARRSAGGTGPTGGESAPEQDLDVIELASAELVRNFELLRRRSRVYEDLDRAEYLLLRTLDRLGPADICTLAKALGVDPSTAGRQVATLQNKGMTERNPSPADRRRTIISPTERGRTRMEAARERRRATTRELLADWDEQDLRTLGHMFTRYNRSVTERFLTAEPAHNSPAHDDSAPESS
jgi:DNA-binding MarR family transcriptional regulator